MRKEPYDPVPRHRTKDLVVRPHDEGTLVLDRRTETAHYLPVEVTQVWGACTGSNTLAEIASAVGINERIAESAVDQLIALDLLDVPSGIDRRRFLRRGALIGAGALTAPVIETVAAPPAWAHGSPRAILAFSCTSTRGSQTQITLTGSGFQAGTYDVVIDAGSTQNNKSFQVVADQSGVITFGPSNIGAANTFAAPKTVTVIISRDSQVVYSFQQTIGPCGGVLNFDPFNTPCIGNQVRVQVQLQEWANNTRYNIVVALSSTGATLVNVYVMTGLSLGNATTNAITLGANAYPPPGPYPVTVTVTRVSSTGVALDPPQVFTGVDSRGRPLTIGPCPPTAAGASQTAPSTPSAAPRATPSSTTPTPAPTTRSSTTPRPTPTTRSSSAAATRPTSTTTRSTPRQPL